jgi:hypothetical protein
VRESGSQPLGPVVVGCDTTRESEVTTAGDLAAGKLRK